MATGIDFPENVTHEDIVGIVDKIVERQGEALAKQSEDRDDDDSDSKETPAGEETPAGDDSVADDHDDEGRDDEDEGDGQEWLTDDLRAEASAIGISDDDLAEIVNRDEFDRIKRLVYKRALKAGEDADADSNDDEGQKPNERSGREKDPKTGKFVAKKPAAEKAKFEVTLDPEFYGKDVVDHFTALRDHYESVIEPLREKLDSLVADSEKRRADEEDRQFDGFVDSLGHEDLFGKSGKETKEQLANRKKVFQAQQRIRNGLSLEGLPSDLSGDIVREACYAKFAEQLMKKQHKTLTSKMRKQSGMRQGGGRPVPTDRPESIREEMRRLYRELESKD